MDGKSKLWAVIVMLGVPIFLLWLLWATVTETGRELRSQGRPAAVRHLDTEQESSPGFNDATFAEIVTPGNALLCAFAALLLWLLWRDIREYRNTGEWHAFVPFLMIVVIIGGVWLYGDYFLTHGGVFVFPLVVLVTLLLLLVWRIVSLNRQSEDYAEQLKEVDKTPVLGDAGIATAEDEKKAGL